MRAGLMRGDLSLRGCTGFQSGIIAATTQANNLTLVTRDIHDFDIGGSSQ